MFFVPVLRSQAHKCRFIGKGWGIAHSVGFVMVLPTTLNIQVFREESMICLAFTLTNSGLAASLIVCLGISSAMHKTVAPTGHYVEKRFLLRNTKKM